jgi:hypothetical protein
MILSKSFFSTSGRETASAMAMAVFLSARNSPPVGHYSSIERQTR